MSRPSALQIGPLGLVLSLASQAGAVDTVTRASPASVAANTAQKTLWITGTGFAPGDRVSISGNGIGEISAPMVVPEAERMDGGRGDGIRYTISVAADAASGRRDITVTGFDGTAATGAGLLEITGGGAPPTAPPTAPPDMGVAPPTGPVTAPPEVPSGGVDVVTRASPIHGEQGEQVNLWIVGRTFQDGATVHFSAAGMGPALVDGLPLPLKVVRNVPSEAEKLDGIEFYLRIGPETPVGPVDITVRGPDGTEATGRALFNVVETGGIPPPVPGAGNADTISGASPPAFRSGRNVSLWIWGRDFEPGADVQFSQPGIRQYSPFEVVNEAGNYAPLDGIRAFLLVDGNVPSGPVDVTVVNPNGSRVTRPGLVEVVGSGGGAAAGGAAGEDVEPCLPASTPIESIDFVTPAEVLRDSPLPLTIVGRGFACGARVALSGGGLRAPEGSTPRIIRDAADPGLTTLRWDLEVTADAAFGPRDVTVVNPDNSTKTLAGAFSIVETLSGDGGVGAGGKSPGISACTQRPGPQNGGAAALLALFALTFGLAASRRRRA
ncbi:hypothetical protein L6V77_13665 [Myxococcota bacterium]|nr:hypothetical protein [Myxococcota bacterium]